MSSVPARTTTKIDASSVAVEQRGSERVLVSKRRFERGEQVYKLVVTDHDVFDAANKYTVQIGDAEHLDFNGTDFEYTQHSCDPNGKFVFEFDKPDCASDSDSDAAMQCHDIVSLLPSVLALHSTRRIDEGELITFDYEMTEFDMGEPFDCQCGSASCRGRISGLKHAAATLLEQRRSDLSPVILKRIQIDEIVQLRRQERLHQNH
jgi:hypothetical protein